MYSRPVRFAFIGCGAISEKHIGALSQLAGAEVVAAVDINPKRAAAFTRKYGIPTYRDEDKMFSKHEIDVVSILTPSGYHAMNAINIIKFGKHIMVEKPLALTLEDADRLIAGCADAKIKLFVVKQNRFNRPVQKLKEAIDSGRLGKMVMGSARVRWCRRQDYYDAVPWRGTWLYDGGVLTNQASHHIDLLLWLMGEVESVMGKSATRLANIEVEDTAVGVLRFTNGALGMIEATTCTRPIDLEGSVSILGEKGSVVIGGFATDRMEVWNFEGYPRETVASLGEWAYNPPNDKLYNFKEYLANAIVSIREDKPSSVDSVQGRRTLELTTAMYESIETGRNIFLRFTPTFSRLGVSSTKLERNYERV